MYAIVEIGGKQVKVEKNQKIFVNRLDAKEGSKVTFDNILLLDNAGKVVLGTPSVNESFNEPLAKALRVARNFRVEI